MSDQDPLALVSDALERFNVLLKDLPANTQSNIHVCWETAIRNLLYVVAQLQQQQFQQKFEAGCAEAEATEVISEAPVLAVEGELEYVRATLAETEEKLEQERAQRGASEMKLEVMREEFQRLAASCRSDRMEREIARLKRQRDDLIAEKAKLSAYTKQARESQKEQTD